MIRYPAVGLIDYPPDTSLRCANTERPAIGFTPPTQNLAPRAAGTWHYFRIASNPSVIAKRGDHFLNAFLGILPMTLFTGHCAFPLPG
jgi:hypothetical protein